MNTLIIILPLIGTLIGTMSTFIIKNYTPKKEQIIMGFSAGIMLVVVFLSLILPAMELTKNFFPIIIGLLLGIFVILSIDITINRNNKNKILIIVIAIILHNIPEGMVTGVGLAGSITNILNKNDALLLSLAITIHNIPEGIVVSILNKNKKKALFYGVLASIVEPISAIITTVIATKVTSIMPYILTFAGGAMLYVIVDELIPASSSKKNKLGIIGLTIGFIIMLTLELVFT